MSGSGAREGSEAPPSNPDDPSPGARETRAVPRVSAPPAERRRESAEDDREPAKRRREAVGRHRETVGGADRDGGGPDDPGAGGEPADGGPRPQKPAWRGLRRRGGRHKKRSFWKELPVLVVVALVLALVIKTYVVQAFFIPSGSMQNTLEIGDRVLINKMVYHTRGIDRGDIIVFNGEGSWDPTPPPGSSNIISDFIGDLQDLVGANNDPDVYIKRVIGLPGDHVACCNAQGKVTVNGVPITEGSYLYPGNTPSTTPFNVTVPAGRLWVMGDHRAISYDSRGHMGQPGGGSIPENSVMGRAFVIIWPPSRWGFLNIPATFSQPKLNASAAAAGGSPKALASAMSNGTPVQSAGTALPLELGFTGAVPLTLAQRSLRRLIRRLRRR